MAKVVREAYDEDIQEFSRIFTPSGPNAAGYSFPCDKDGNVLNPTSENYLKCIDGTFSPMYDHGIVDYSRTYRHAAIIECNVCKSEVDLGQFTNTCDTCGTDYGFSGSQLNPRWMWGEETGEHFGNPPSNYGDY